MYRIILMIFCFTNGIFSMNCSASNWRSLDDPMILRNASISDPHIENIDNLVNSKIKELCVTHDLSSYEKIAILWVAKEAFSDCQPTVASDCFTSILQLLSTTLGIHKISNYHIGYSLLRSQCNCLNPEDPLEACRELKRDYNDGIILAAIQLLHNEKNGFKEESEKILHMWAPILQKNGFDL